MALYWCQNEGTPRITLDTTSVIAPTQTRGGGRGEMNNVGNREEREMKLSDDRIARNVDIADALNTRGITLNGLPARVGGTHNQFATVHQIPCGLAVEYAWPTLQRMVQGGAHTLTA